MMTGQYCPIMACRPLEDPAAAPYHRRWLVVDAEGCLLTQRHQPRLAEVVVAINFGYLAIRAPGMLRMDIPLDVIEDDDSVLRRATIGAQQVDVVDEGDLAAAWISNFLGVPSRLVKVHPDVPAVMWPE
jgi:uncharacterized protein YcbX